MVHLPPGPGALRQPAPRPRGWAARSSPSSWTRLGRRCAGHLHRHRPGAAHHRRGGTDRGVRRPVAGRGETRSTRPGWPPGKPATASTRSTCPSECSTTRNTSLPSSANRYPPKGHRPYGETRPGLVRAAVVSARGRSASGTCGSVSLARLTPCPVWPARTTFRIGSVTSQTLTSAPPVTRKRGTAAPCLRARSAFAPYTTPVADRANHHASSIGLVIPTGRSADAGGRATSTGWSQMD